MGKSFVVKVSLNTKNPVDAEVYSLLKDCKSGAEVKNYLVNAILYYARSPLVHSTGLMEKLISLLEKGYTGLQDNSNGVKVSESFEVSLTAPLENYPSITDNPEFKALGESNKDNSRLVSLKDKFKI